MGGGIGEVALSDETVALSADAAFGSGGDREKGTEKGRNIIPRDGLHKSGIGTMMGDTRHNSRTKIAFIIVKGSKKGAFSQRGFLFFERKKGREKKTRLNL